MFDDLKKTITEFRKAKSIAIYSPRINTIDKAVSIATLAKICFQEGKDFQVICPKELNTSVQNVFINENIKVIPDLRSRDYVVSVDYSSANIEKVVCKRDEEGKKLNFVITPKDDLFNFDNVELISGGSSFDLVFSFGLYDLDSLDKSFAEIFSKVLVVSITKKETEIGKYKFLINGKRSYSEVVYEFLKAFSNSSSEENLNLLLQGVISKYKLLENGNNEGWLVVNKFIKYGADFNKAFRALNYSKDYKNLELQKKVMENVKIEKESRVIWSKVELIQGMGVEDLDLRGRILFNISKDFDLAFVIYQIDEETVKVVVESNQPKKYSAVELARVFSGVGTSSRAVFTEVGTTAMNFEIKLFRTIDSLFGIKLS